MLKKSFAPETIYLYVKYLIELTFQSNFQQNKAILGKNSKIQQVKKSKCTHKAEMLA